jgi:hypothetical protein
VWIGRIGFHPAPGYDPLESQEMHPMVRHRLLPAALLVLAAAILHAEGPATAPATITIDTSAAPEFADFATRLQPIVDEWYPKIEQMLPSDGYVAPRKVRIVFDPNYDGVAAASGGRIVASTKYFAAHREDLGAFVHELVHVVQHYGRGDRPGWLTEGIADYIRFFHYEPESARPHPNPQKAKHSDSYRTTGHFLDWAQRTYDPDLVVKLNAACREARYSEELWKQYTGKTLEELGAEWKASLKQR